jgi:hypothetical protein
MMRSRKNWRKPECRRCRSEARVGVSGAFRSRGLPWPTPGDDCGTEEQSGTHDVCDRKPVKLTL